MNVNKQGLLLIAFGGLVVFAIVYAFLPKPIPVEIARVTRGPLQVTVDHEGRTRVKERYVISAPLSGRLLRVELHPGDPVRAKETLLTSIEPSDPALLDPRARAEAEARVKAAEAGKRRAIPALDRARVASEQAKTELERAQTLYTEGAMSHQELDNAELKSMTADEELKAAEFSVQIATFELEQAEAVLSGGKDHTAGTPFEIRSPINGELLRVFQESENFVQSGTRLLEIGDLHDLEMEIDVLSRDGVKIKPGDKVWVEHWGGEAPLLGRVRLVEPSAFLKVSALGVEEQRVNVIADFVDPPEKRPTLGDAYRIEARIVISESDNVLKVPVSALFRRGEGWAVFAMQRGRALLRPVKIGRRNDLEAEVLSGVSENETVVVHPSDKIQNMTGIRERKD
jgi:HlyD family secretion protein